MIRPSRKNMLWTGATFLIAAAPQLIRMPLPVVLMTLLPVVWRLASEFRGWKPLPALVRHSATAIALVTIFTSYGTLMGRRAAVSLLTMMLALKLLECYRLRDTRIIVSFSLFLCATQFLFAQGIVMPIYGGLTVVFALVSLAQLHRTESFAPVGPAPAVSASLSSELGFGFRLLAVAAPVGLSLFLFFPRWASPLWGLPESSMDGKTGLSGSMSPGSIETLFMDDSPAFRVQFEGAAPVASELYWRGPVFWNFDGETWETSYYGKNIDAASLPDAETAPWHYTVQLEPSERHWLFALDYPAMVPFRSRLSMDFQLRRRFPVTQLFEYQMASDPGFVDTPSLEGAMREIALDLPAQFNPRTREMMKRWRRETPDDIALVRRVLDYFNTEEFHYSLEAPLLGRHTVDEFLFDTRKGYCEHYASAFTVMMRMAGIPSRVVTGYQGGWYNELGDYVLVRQSDAHAWSEVWLPYSGWTRTDPTAAVSPLRVEQGSLGALSSPRHLLDYAWLRSLRNGFDIVQQQWNDLVIEFSAERQARLFAPLGIERMSPAVLVSFLLVFCAVCFILLLPVVLKIRGPTDKDPIKSIWRRFLKRLKRAGFDSPPSSGPVELGQSAAAHLPDHAEIIRRISDLYNRSRYSADPPDMQDLREAVKGFRPARQRN